MTDDELAKSARVFLTAQFPNGVPCVCRTSPHVGWSPVGVGAVQLVAPAGKGVAVLMLACDHCGHVLSFVANPKIGSSWRAK